MTEAAPIEAPAPQVIVAKAGSYYRNMRYLMCVLLIGLGGWFAYDGFYNWPKLNQENREFSDQRDKAMRDKNTPESERLLTEINKHPLHTPADIFLNKALAFVLPVAGVGVLAWALYRSRGEYRLEDQTLTVPGHPPVELSQITDIDKRLWDRKGIAHISYATADGKTGEMTLDDFVYDRAPTDLIYEKALVAFTAKSPETIAPAQGA